MRTASRPVAAAFPLRMPSLCWCETCAYDKFQTIGMDLPNCDDWAYPSFGYAEQVIVEKMQQRIAWGSKR